MSLVILRDRPKEFDGTHLPDPTFYASEDEVGVVARIAVQDRGEFLEIHGNVHKWGPRSCETLRGDIDQISDWARESGRGMLVAYSVDHEDERFPKFMEMIGFKTKRVWVSARRVA